MDKKPKQKTKPVVGLILAGGGARAAYQVGVLKAIAHILPARAKNPFPIICGTSAGAINGAVIAINANRYSLGVKRLVKVWNNFSVNQVFRADTMGIIKSGAHWLATLMLGGLGKYNPCSLLDRTPLRHLLGELVPCHEIKDSIDSGALHAFSVTAAGYTSAQSVIFYQGKEDIAPWKRARRIGVATEITMDHLLASSAIPFVFEAVKINREYFGDGSMRQTAPISPALHLGADKVMVIGVRRDEPEEPERLKTQHYPSLAHVAGYVLDSIFLDSLETDLERLRRINKTVALIPPEKREHGALRPVEVLVIAPSEDIQAIAARHIHELPWALRLLLRGVGALNKSGANFMSYLLFEKSYCRELIDMGFRDTMKRKDEVLAFLGHKARDEV